MGQTALSNSVRAIEGEIAAGRPERALALCQDAQTAHPRALAVLRVMGEVYLALRKTREAVSALDRALAGNPEDARACCARAIVLQIQGDSMGALAWYRRACDTRPDDAVLRSAYRELAMSLGQPAYTPTRMGLARLYLRGDLFPHAIREFETLLAEQPDSLEAQLGLAETFWRAHRPQAAAERCRHILMNTPSCVKALLILAATEQIGGNAEEAQRLVKRAVELDPDMRIGQELFADQLAAGDSMLRVLLFGAKQTATRANSLPLPLPQYAAPTTSAQSQPLRSAAQSQPLRPAAQSQPLRPAAQSQPLSPAASTQPRPAGLPPDFHTIFAETEYMLWGHDDETVGRVAAMSRANGQPNPDSFAGSSSFVPPALQQQGSPLDDTEARAAINWISWLQAQGARPHGSAPSGPRGATGPLPLSAGGTGALTPPATGPLPWELSASYAAPGDGRALPAQSWRDTGHLPPPPTGPLPPPTPEALRQMFAELEPEASTSRVVDGSLVAERIAGEDSGNLDDSNGDSAVHTDSSAWSALAERSDTADGEAEPERMTSSSRPVIDFEAASVEQTDGFEPESPFSAFADSPAPEANGATSAHELAWSDSQAAAMGWTLSGKLPENLAQLRDSGPAGAVPADDAFDVPPIAEIETGALTGGEAQWGGSVAEQEAPVSAAQPHEAPAGPETLEALERGFANSGFQPFELRPGGVAAIMSASALDGTTGDSAAYDSGPEHGAAPFDVASHTPEVAPFEGQATAPLSAEAQGTEPLGFVASQSQQPAPEASEGRSGVDGGDQPQRMPESGGLPLAASPAEVRGTNGQRPYGSAHATADASEPTLAPDDYAGRLALARQRRSDGRMADALAEYRLLLKNSPDLLADVMSDLRDELAEQPEHPELHRLLGDAHIRQGDYLSALESYNRAVALTQAQEN